MTSKKRSVAAKKAWKTRRANELKKKRSKAAKKAWRTRIANELEAEKEVAAIWRTRIANKLEAEKKAAAAKRSAAARKGAATRRRNRANREQQAMIDLIQGDTPYLRGRFAKRSKIRPSASVRQDVVVKQKKLAEAALKKSVAYEVLCEMPVALQFPPMIRRCNFVGGNRYGDSNGDNYTYELAFPYTIFQFIPQLRVYFANEPIVIGKELPDLYLPPLPHISFEGSVCQMMNQIAHHNRGHVPKSLEDRIKAAESIITNFFNCKFIEGYHVQAALPGDTKLRSYKKWQRLTKESEGDLSFITEVNWTAFGNGYPAPTKRALTAGAFGLMGWPIKDLKERMNLTLRDIQHIKNHRKMF